MRKSAEKLVRAAQPASVDEAVINCMTGINTLHELHYSPQLCDLHPDINRAFGGVYAVTGAAASADIKGYGRGGIVFSSFDEHGAGAVASRFSHNVRGMVVSEELAFIYSPTGQSPQLFARAKKGCELVPLQWMVYLTAPEEAGSHSGSCTWRPTVADCAELLGGISTRRDSKIIRAFMQDVLGKTTIFEYNPCKQTTSEVAKGILEHIDMLRPMPPRHGKKDSYRGSRAHNPLLGLSNAAFFCGYRT